MSLLLPQRQGAIGQNPNLIQHHHQTAKQRHQLSYTFCFLLDLPTAFADEVEGLECDGNAKDCSLKSTQLQYG